MRILLDENVPHELRTLLTPHEVQTAQYAGLAGLLNGALLKAAEAEFDALVTLDRRLSFQNNLQKVDLILITIRAKRVRFVDLIPLVPEIMTALEQASAGERILIPGKDEA